MKRLFIALALVLMLSAVDKFQVEIVDSNNVIVANPEVTVGEWVIVSLPNGNYVARVRAGNIWGWSDYSDPLDFTKVLPDAPQNIRLEF
jgi:hypothetical protein